MHSPRYKCCESFLALHHHHHTTTRANCQYLYTHRYMATRKRPATAAGADRRKKRLSEEKLEGLNDVEDDKKITCNVQVVLRVRPASSNEIKVCILFCLQI
jgi:hypothetical protein